MKRTALRLVAAGVLVLGAAVNAGAVDSVIAGAGLKGGGVGPAVTLNVAPGPGIRIVADRVRVGFAGTSCPDGKYLVGFTPAGALACSCLGGICATQALGVDATGDSTGPDILSVELAVGNGNLTAKILFVPGTFNKDLHYVGINIDADQDAATGSPWWGAGLEYAVLGGGSCAIPGAQVYTTGVGFANAGNLVALPNGYIFTVPMSALGNDDGEMAIGGGGVFCGLLSGGRRRRRGSGARRPWRRAARRARTARSTISFNGPSSSVAIGRCSVVRLRMSMSYCETAQPPLEYGTNIGRWTGVKHFPSAP